MAPIMGTPVKEVNRFSGSRARDNIGMSIGLRVKQARKAAQMTQVELARKSGLKQSTISDLEVGKSQGTTFVASLAAAMGVSPLWLETGRGNMVPTLAQSAAAPDESDNPFLEDSRSIRVGDEPASVPIRKVKLKLHAGISGFETEPEQEDGGILHMPLALIEQNRFVPHQLLATRVRGCSMEPMMFEDDWVVINTADKQAVSREIYAVNFNGEACIKQLLNQGGQWYLHSLNPDFKPINVRSGQCNIVGRVVYQPGRLVTGRL